MLKAVSGHNVPDMEIKIKKALETWFLTFRGWSLLFWIPDKSYHRVNIFCAALLNTNRIWDEATKGPKTPSKVFDEVKIWYEKMHGDFKYLVPSFDIRFVCGPGRKKRFHVRFLDLTVAGISMPLEISFYLEKKRINETLVDWAAETLVRRMTGMEDLRNLETGRIPRELVRGKITEKYKDAQWVENHCECWKLPEENQ